LAPVQSQVIAPGLIEHDQIPELLAACDLLTPSPHAPNDGFVGSPMKLFEYLASGRAIVASRLEQLAQVITHERNGLMVGPGDVEELYAAVTRFIRSPDLRATLGAQARLDAENYHTWRARTASILEAITRAE
jgi:glycosyltransferase involved in cell wall biosynthesis